jgi:hypothetical protein
MRRHNSHNSHNSQGREKDLSLKRPQRADWSDYENAKAVINRYNLDPQEYGACIRFIANRLKL